MAKRSAITEAMPTSLRAIAKIIGEQNALKLVMECGGTMVYVPSKVTSESLLVKAIGEAAVGELAKSSLAGTAVDLPLGGKAVTLWLASQGIPNNEIARIQKITAHTVGRRLNKKKIAADQMELFEARVAKRA